MQASISLRILAAVLLIGCASLLSQYARSGWDPVQAGDFVAVSGLVLGVVGVAAGVGLWWARRWGAVLLVIFATVALLRFAHPFVFRDTLDVLMVPSLAVLYGFLIWFAWVRTGPSSRGNSPTDPEEELSE